MHFQISHFWSINTYDDLIYSNITVIGMPISNHAT